MMKCDQPSHGTLLPREKLLHLGSQSLNNAELLAILLGSGTKGKNVLSLAEELLDIFGNLKNLLHAQTDTLQQTKGLGQVKCLQLRAVIELIQRYLYESIDQTPIKGSKEVSKFLQAKMSHLTREVFSCLLLDSQHRIIKYVELFFGSLRQAEIHPREIIKLALQYNAASMILAHNHPSGDPTPSDSDHRITKTIQKALSTIDVLLLDHLVIGHGKVCFLMSK